MTCDTRTYLQSRNAGHLIILFIMNKAIGISSIRKPHAVQCNARLGYWIMKNKRINTQNKHNTYAHSRIVSNSNGIRRQRGKITIYANTANQINIMNWVWNENRLTKLETWLCTKRQVILVFGSEALRSVLPT